MIEFRNVTKVYSTGIAAVNNTSLYIEKGEFVFIVGLATLTFLLTMLE